MSSLKKIVRTGWCYSFAIAFNRVVPQWLFRCRRFVIYELAQSRSENTTVEGLELNWCNSESAILEAAEFSKVGQAISCGENSVCRATLAGKLVGAFWTTGNSFNEHEIEIQIALSPKQNWLFSAYVDRDFRNQGIYTSLLKFFTAELLENGISSPLVAVNPDNLGSNHVHRKYSDSSPGTVLAIRFLTIAVCFASGRVKPDRWLTLSCKKNPIKIQIQNMPD